MGSTHSTANVATPNVADETTTSSSVKDTAAEGLSGMPLVHHQCRRPKKSYDKCVRKWYRQEFITGGGTLNQEEACGDKFDEYRLCVLKGIRKEIWDKQGLPPPSDESPLAEVDDDEQTTP